MAKHEFRVADAEAGGQEEGKPTAVEPFVPGTELEKKFHAGAEELDKSRKDIERLMSRASCTDEDLGERITMRFLARPTDVTWGDKVHGGTVMGWINEAAYACTQRWTGGEAIAVYAGGVRFYRPMSGSRSPAKIARRASLR